MQLTDLLSQLEICYQPKITGIKISNFFFLHNDSNPKKPIQWLSNPTKQYLQQFHILLHKLGYTTNYQEEKRTINGNEQTIIYCDQSPTLGQQTKNNLEYLRRSKAPSAPGE